MKNSELTSPPFGRYKYIGKIEKMQQNSVFFKPSGDVPAGQEVCICFIANMLPRECFSATNSRDSMKRLTTWYTIPSSTWHIARHLIKFCPLSGHPATEQPSLMPSIIIIFSFSKFHRRSVGNKDKP
jgi:hypothetical protein